MKVIIFLFLLSGTCFFLVYLMRKRTNNALSEYNVKEKISNFGQYIIGLPNVDLQYNEVTCGISDKGLIFVSNVGKVFGRIPLKSISNIYIDRKTNISQRLTATRILALGIFSLAAPKSKKTEEYCLVIEWYDEANIVQNTIFEFTGCNCASFANSAYSKLIRYIQPKKMSNISTIPSTADEISKLSRLKDQGIISTEEFEAKKKQLLDL
jgi:hypothetical protein